MCANVVLRLRSALFAVFSLVIFFWFSFHQNGYSLTYFSRDYIKLDIINIDLGFTQIIGAEIFQSVNPFFVVFLTPIIIGIFGAMIPLALLYVLYDKAVQFIMEKFSILQYIIDFLPAWSGDRELLQNRITLGSGDGF